MNKTFRIRRASQDDAVEIARIHIVATRAAYRDIYTAEYLNSLSVEDRAHRWVEKDRGHLAIGDPFSVFVAFDDDVMVGFADVGPTDKNGVGTLRDLLASRVYRARCGQGSFGGVRLLS
jgi:hypothetical protein